MKNKVINKMNFNKLLTQAMDLAEEMLRCNAEINRVEDTVIRICSVKGVKQVDVFAIKSLIITTLKIDDGIIDDTITQSRRVVSSDTNLAKLEELNSISRYICSKRPSSKDIQKKLDAIKNIKGNSRRLDILGYILSTGPFCIFFGGNLRDAIASSLISVLIYYVNIYIKKRMINQIVFTTVSSMIMAFSAIILVKLGLGVNVDKIIIGDIMLLIPGISLINSARDMLCGDILAGLVRLIETFVIAVAIAGGCAFGLLTLGVILK
ncbi:MAG: threonine/serine exporter family protein [Sarcina sp.]